MNNTTTTKGNSAVKIADIKFDEQLQMRVELCQKTIKEYAALYETGDDWPFDTPVVLFDVDGELFMANGFHRAESAKSAGRDTLEATIRPGTFQQAFEYALSANQDHGLRRSGADKRRSVVSALEDSDDNGVRIYAESSNRKLAKLCGVSEGFVRKVKKELETIKERLTEVVAYDELPDGQSVLQISKAKPQDQGDILERGLEIAATQDRAPLTKDFEKAIDELKESNSEPTKKTGNVIESSQVEFAVKSGAIEESEASVVAGLTEAIESLETGQAIVDPESFSCFYRTGNSGFFNIRWFESDGSLFENNGSSGLGVYLSLRKIGSEFESFKIVDLPDDSTESLLSVVMPRG